MGGVSSEGIPLRGGAIAEIVQPTAVERAAESLRLGVLKPCCSKPGCLQCLRFCALLCSFADLRLRSPALICALLRSFALFLCPTAFRTTAFLEGPEIDKNPFSLERMKKQKKTFPQAQDSYSGLNFSFLVRKLHARLRISIRGLVFFCGQRGSWSDKTTLD